MRKADVIIVGSGIAALQLANTLNNQLHVIIITKSNKESSNSSMAQGGISAAISPQDHIMKHYQDTLEAGRWHHNEKEVHRLVKEGKEIVEDIIQKGLPVDRTESGELSLGMEGAHSVERIVHSGGDATGRFVIQHLLKTLPSNVEIIENETVISLLQEQKSDRCIGVVTKNKRDRTMNYFAPNIVLATGGAGRFYSFTSNHHTISGDGLAMAYLAGAQLTDLEFVQFHPTLLFVNGETKGLVSEAVRGAGGILTNQFGQKIMRHKHPMKDLAPRHIVAHEIFKERAKGNDVYLDISSIVDFTKKFPTITKMCEEQGISIKDGLIPVAPGSHFLMGGVVVNSVGETCIQGLYAIGEVACTGVHGSNRLASNSLLEGLVYGKRLGNYLNEREHHRTFLIPKKLKDLPAIADYPINQHEFRLNMMKAVGVIREKDRLITHLNWLNDINRESLGKVSIEEKTVEGIHSYFMWIIGKLMTESALLRSESRGGHIRLDHPDEKKSWCQKRIVHRKVNGEMKVTFDEQLKIKSHA
ncbi:L-aspartate oxidase [Bacillus spongiae]|uniref:L-aspartate oxidase n=1 Tax=Bacillus spongiae TaxID=2683610 RepID=A0ABU8H8W8_9BACI